MRVMVATYAVSAERGGRKHASILERTPFTSVSLIILADAYQPVVLTTSDGHSVYSFLREV
jgi:hypothetical protein